MKTSPLHAAHQRLGARMVDFSGWWMPIQYPSGIHEEHIAVRERAGVFDVSHMGELRVDGAGALELLRWALLNDAKKLRIGRAHYTMMPNDRGGLIDDLYVYRLAESSWLLVVNAANTEIACEHLARLAADVEDARVRNASSEWALLALQGPGAALALERHVDVDVTSIRKNDTLPARFGGRPVRLARTGYTGEDGFEVFVRPDDAESVWTTLIDGAVAPCGLGARDTLRLEAGFPLYGHELTDTTDPRCTPFSWVVKDKPHYGRESYGDPACARRLVGLKLLGRGIARQGYRVLDRAENGGGEAVGEITSGTVSPVTRDSLAFAWLDAGLAEEGREVAVEIRGQRVSATVTSPPFLRAGAA